MTVRKDEVGPLRRIILAIDASEASAKAVSFVLTKFRPDSSTGEGAQVALHVSVVHVMARRPLAPISSDLRYPGSNRKRERRMSAADWSNSAPST